MPNVSVYNETGSQVGSLVLSDALFAVKPEQAIIHEAMVAQRANARRAIANTKTRGEVRGGGKKPWKQKGTGRARQGSIRSPQWVGGGITFGPTSERNFSVKINKKLKRKALFMALSDKVQNQKLMVLESLAITSAKTKYAASVIAKLPIDRNVLLVVPGASAVLMRMVRNLQNVKLVSANSVNLIDVLTYRSVVFFKDAVPVFEGLYRD
ncbi:50S ribosomal protein L4 [Patescibacteria group bacterium]|nr:50S ribosomal protein L4 [Patescibacteria group bacterium]MBP9710157.1 50S ribosomal protein L4 [Patescibacteria group bacterium]